MIENAMEECNCIDCVLSDFPCQMDCEMERDAMCQGCMEALEEAKDRDFDEKCALGYI